MVPPTVIDPLNVGAEVRYTVVVDANFSGNEGHGISTPLAVFMPPRSTRCPMGACAPEVVVSPKLSADNEVVDDEFQEHVTSHWPAVSDTEVTFVSVALV